MRLLKVIALFAIGALIAVNYRALKPAPRAECPAETELATIPGVAGKVAGSVVSISAITAPSWTGFDGVQRLFSVITPGSTRRVEGTGVIIDPSGLVLTVQHVVNGAQQISVALARGRECTATLVAVDPARDVALLQLPRDGTCPSIEGRAGCLGDSDRLRVGDWVVSIGSAFSLRTTVTQGIVSALGRQLTMNGRTYSSLIQTDAVMNPGDSGGPVIDMRGRIVGLNAAIAPRGYGIGFAIPINVVKKAFPRLATSTPTSPTVATGSLR